MAVVALALFAGFVALGTWQVQRRGWKLDLIDRVAQRVHAPAADAPDDWSNITAARDEYRHVRLAGRFLDDKTTLVQATTEHGSGFWVVTPLRLEGGARAGRVVLVNRGFVPDAERDAARRMPVPTGEQTLTGLLRMPEPGGFFPRRNDPAADRWFSRDVPAIASARGLGEVAPYFVDADAAPEAKERAGTATAEPIGGLTVVAFHNNHLVYAITWYGLALMVVLAAWWVARDQNAGSNS